MLEHPGCHLGDSWYIVADDTVHCFYLVCPDTVERHTAWDIAHATSRDLIEWDLHGTVVERGQPGEWDGNCLATGSVVRYRDSYVMAYTARWNELGVATGIARSDDLYTWHKQPSEPATVPGPPYVTDRPWDDRPPTHWRDPFLINDHDDQLTQLVAASRPDRPANASGTVGVARSIDGESWELSDPLELDAVARELECPQIHHIDGRWFLIFSAFPELFSDAVRSDPTAELREGTYAMVADERDGPFRFVQRTPILPAGHHQQPYAAQVVTFGGRPHLIGTLWRDDGRGDRLSDPVALRRDGDRLVPSDDPADPSTTHSAQAHEQERLS